MFASRHGSRELEKKKQDAKDRQNSEQQKLDSVTGTIGSIQGNVDAAAEEVEEVDAALVETIASVEIIEEELKEKAARLDQLNILLNMDKREPEVIADTGAPEAGEQPPARKKPQLER